MGMLDRLFGKRSHVSPRPGVIDLRGKDALSMAREAKSPLSSEDEEFALKLVDLVQRYDALYSGDRSSAEVVQQEIKRIGEHLCADGGDARMQRIAYRVEALGVVKRVRIRDLELHWDGICGWMY